MGGMGAHSVRAMQVRGARCTVPQLPWSVCRDRCLQLPMRTTAMPVSVLGHLLAMTSRLQSIYGNGQPSRWGCLVKMHSYRLRTDEAEIGVWDLGVSW